jgi:putative hydrolase of the HAD superfamily
LAVVNPTPRAVDSILCDIGDVLLLFDLEVVQAIERRHRLKPASLLARTIKSPAGKLAMVGSIDTSEWRRRTLEEVPCAALEEWLAYHGSVNKELVDVLAEAQGAGTTVYFLSNALSRLWDDLAYHGLSDLADRVFCSSEIGAAKPDQRAYEYVRRAVSLDFSRTLYVDDTPSWVDAGRGLGMIGQTYVSTDGVRRELHRLGAI